MSSPLVRPLPAQPPTPEGEVGRAFPRVRAYLARLLADYGPEYGPLRSPLEQLVVRGRQTPCEFGLPLLVHAAAAGTVEPAVPIAAVHALWWRAANTFDDVADGERAERLYGMPGGAALTAALECGYALPLRALAALPAPEPLRRRLRQDYLDTWTAASNGQIGDLLNHPAAVDPETVLAVYRHKSGAVYEMAAVMAARLAIGTGYGNGARPEREEPGAAEEERILDWGRFGHLLGVLAQFRNDEDDLRAGQDDLHNGTATYLLVHLLHTVPRPRREQALSLLADAPSCAERRRELHGMMREPDVLRPYRDHVRSLAREAHALLDALAPDSPHAPGLHALVDAESRFATAPADAGGEGSGGRDG